MCKQYLKTVYVMKCAFNNQHHNALTSNAIGVLKVSI